MFKKNDAFSIVLLGKMRIVRISTNDCKTKAAPQPANWTPGPQEIPCQDFRRTTRLWCGHNIWLGPSFSACRCRRSKGVGVGCLTVPRVLQRHVGDIESLEFDSIQHCPCKQPHTGGSSRVRPEYKGRWGGQTPPSSKGGCPPLNSVTVW